MSIFSELMRRHVFRVGAAYLVVAWLLLQIFEVVLPTLQLPDWTVTLVTVLLALGFPVTLYLAWTYDIVPDGVERTDKASEAESEPGGTVDDEDRSG